MDGQDRVIHEKLQELARSFAAPRGAALTAPEMSLSLAGNVVEAARQRLHDRVMALQGVDKETLLKIAQILDMTFHQFRDMLPQAPAMVLDIIDQVYHRLVDGLGS